MALKGGGNGSRTTTHSLHPVITYPRDFFTLPIPRPLSNFSPPIVRPETSRESRHSALSNRSIVRTVNYYEEREGTLLSLCARERGMDGETKWSVKLQTDIKFLGCGERGEEGGKKAELSRKELKFNDDGTRLNLTSIDPKFNYNYALI